MDRKKKPQKRTPERVKTCPKSDVSSSVEQPLIDVFARLNNTFIDTKDYCDEENEIEYNFRPRRIYMNGLCLNCLQLCRPETRCESCKMVSYCSEKHRLENHNEHKNLCKMLTDIFNPQNSLKLEQNSTPEEYRSFRVKLIELMEKSIERPLELWEKEIMLYPRLCRICYKVCDKYCSECGVEFLCTTEDHVEKHSRWCLFFQLYSKIVQLQKINGNVKPQLPNVISDVAYKLSDSFDEVMKHFFGGTKLYRIMDCYNYSLLSHLSTVPLSTFFAYQKTYEKDWRTKKHLTVHIIGPEFEFECADFRFWEKFFVHFVPNLKELNLLMIGPELQAPEFLLNALSKTQMCSRCKSKRKAINVEFHPNKLYHEVKLVKKPNLICLFNPGLYRVTGYSARDTWPETIKKFCDYKVPVVVTSYTEFEIPQDLSRIKSISPVKIILKAQRNSFASLKPDRNFVSDHEDPLIFKNYFISIVQGI